MPNRLTPAWQFATDDYPTALAVSRDGSLVAIGTAAGSLTVLDASTGEIVQRIAEAHVNGVLCIAFGKSLLASGGQDGQARLWDARSGEQKALMPGGGSWVQHLLFTADGKRLATAAGKSVKLWDASGTLQREWTAKAGVNGLAFNPVGGLLAAAVGAEVLLWRCADGGLDRTLKWASTLLNVHCAPDGKIIACGSIDKTVHFWRTGVWSDSQMAGYLTKPLSLAWSADGKQLATTGDECLIVWNFAGKGPEGVAPIQLYGHTTPPTLVATHPKKPLLLSGGKDTRLILWEPRAKTEPLGLVKLGGEVAALAFNPNASLAYAADAGGQLSAFWIETA